MVSTLLLVLSFLYFIVTTEMLTLISIFVHSAASTRSHINLKKFFLFSLTMTSKVLLCEIMSVVAAHVHHSMLVLIYYKVFITVHTIRIESTVVPIILLKLLEIRVLETNRVHI